jgi:hypothetical protein
MWVPPVAEEEEEPMAGLLGKVASDQEPSPSAAFLPISGTGSASPIVGGRYLLGEPLIEEFQALKAANIEHVYGARFSKSNYTRG